MSNFHIFIYLFGNVLLCMFTRLGHRLPFITCNDEHLCSLKPTIIRPFSTLHYSDNLQMATTIQTASVLPSGKAAVLAKNDNDVVIVAAVRSAMTKVLHEVLLSRFPS
jgi:hypothetical protein